MITYGEIARFDSVLLKKRDNGWQTTVTPEQMLTEILTHLANSNSNDPTPVTVSYAPPDPPEIAERMNAINRKYGLPELFPLPGRHHVSLWTRTYNEDEDRVETLNRISFMFTTDPDIDFWDGESGILPVVNS